jgi:hypothetical protein
VTLNRVSLTAGSVTAPATTLAGTTPTTAIPTPDDGTGGADGGTAVTCHCTNSDEDTVGGAGGSDNGAGNPGTPSLGGVILPRFGGLVDYAAKAAICDLNSNSIGLT